MSYYALVLGLAALFRSDAIFTAIIAVLIFWHIATWMRVARRGNAFVSLLIDSASLMMYAGTFLYSRLVPNAFTVKAGNPATALTSIALLGLISALIGFGFGVGGSTRQERGGLSATLLAVIMGLLWLPASFV